LLHEDACPEHRGGNESGTPEQVKVRHRNTEALKRRNGPKAHHHRSSTPCDKGRAPRPQADEALEQTGGKRDAATTELTKQHLIDPEICIRCNTCETTCPVGAITHDLTTTLSMHRYAISDHPVFFKAEHFAVNILADDQIEWSNRFAKSFQEKFAGLEVHIGLGGVPLLRGCSAWLQCRVFSRIPGGDHTIYLGEVHSIDRAERKPLVFGNGQYLRTDPHDHSDSARR
jgi:NAD-dependent dihydropyrimidine dehydrogenase PreA subunit